MIVAITGTPGVGKTSVCSHLCALGFQVIDINKLVSERFHKGFDNKRKCFVADLRKLRKHIKRIHKSAAKEKQGYNSRQQHEGILLLDSHISHLLHPDVAIVLRANPLELAERLRRKGFEERKIKENVRAETLDVILVEAVERCKFVYEIDTTGKSVEAVAECVREILSALRENTEERRKEMSAKYKVGGVDWSEYVEDVFAHCDDC
ncbi:MAG: adenylate kinase family protein [Candidatus Methanospirare jalkutatii]|nr:adenylate kinase family protein [Candidatus Methanospirare jalkutatii]